MNDIVAIISLFGGASGIGVFLWYLVNLRQKRKVEWAEADKAGAEADKAAAEAERSRQDNKQDLLDWVKEQMLTFNTRLNEMSHEITNVRYECNDLRATIKGLDLTYCDKFSCGDRNPPLGQHHTDIKKYSKNELNNNNNG